MTALEIYWLTRLPHLSEIGVAVTIGSFVAAALLLCFAPAWASEDFGSATSRLVAKIVAKVAVGCLLIGGLIKLFVPTTQDLAVIFAGAWAVNSEEMQKLPDNVVKTINKYLESYLEDQSEKDGKIQPP